jgi:hypothetical protein
LGEAKVSGNAEVSKKVITISSSHYRVTITDNHIRIGCQQHTIKAWTKLSKNKLIEMDGEKSAETWFKYKEFILMLANGE